jgi:large subunit ribosomal protein L24
MKFNASLTKQPRKKRYAMYNAALHEKRKMVFIHIGGELAKKLQRNSISPHKGDKVKILRGKFAGASGKIIEVDLKRVRLLVEGASTKKANGKEEFLPIHPSKVILLETDRKLGPKPSVLVKAAPTTPAHKAAAVTHAPAKPGVAPVHTKPAAAPATHASTHAATKPAHPAAATTPAPK